MNQSANNHVIAAHCVIETLEQRALLSASVLDAVYEVPAGEAITLDFGSDDASEYAAAYQAVAGSGSSLNIVTGEGKDQLDIVEGKLNVNGQSIDYSGFDTVGVVGSGDSISFDVELEIGGEFGDITIGPGGIGAITNITLILTGPLNISPTGGLSIDRGDYMIIQADPLQKIIDFIEAGHNGGSWDGLGGLRSDDAAANPLGTTGLGYGLNSDLQYSVFGGRSVVPSDILVRYTYYGDNDLNGTVDFSDLALFINGFNSGADEWWLGNYNYNNSVAYDDLTLFIVGYNNQGPPLGGVSSFFADDAEDEEDSVLP